MRVVMRMSDEVQKTGGFVANVVTVKIVVVEFGIFGVGTVESLNSAVKKPVGF